MAFKKKSKVRIRSRLLVCYPLYFFRTAEHNVAGISGEHRYSLLLLFSSSTWSCFARAEKSFEHHRRRNVPPFRLRHRPRPNPLQDSRRNQRSRFRTVPDLHVSCDFLDNLSCPRAHPNRAQAPHSSLLTSMAPP